MPRFSTALVTLLMCGAAQSALAQAAPAGPMIEEVVVTAQKRAENVQDVPIAISAFTGTALKERAVADVSSLSNLAPNVTFDGGTPFSGSTAILAAYIRGIGANDFAFNLDPGVGIYLDGVYLARAVGANQDLGDVERIEILKGPQGTLFGRNTIGGAVSIVTHEPGDQFRLNGEVTGGSYKLFQVRGLVDVPIVENLNSSLAFSVKRRDGYMERIPFPGVASFNNPPTTSFKGIGYKGGLGDEGGENNWSVRGKVVWKDGGPFRLSLSGDYSLTDQEAMPNTLIKTVPFVFAGTYNCALTATVSPACGGGPPSFAYSTGVAGLFGLFDLPSSFGVNVDSNPSNDRVPYDDRFLTGNIDKSYATADNFSKIRNWGLAANASYDLTANLQLKSITAYRDLAWRTGVDLDGSPLNFLQLTEQQMQHQFSQEFQLLGNALDKKLNYVLGAYYFQEAGFSHDFVNFAEGLLEVDGRNNLKTKNGAVFAQIDWRINDLIGITIGGRYTKEKKEFEGFQTDSNGLTYKILQAVGVPPCASLTPISEACRIAAGFPNPGQPLRYYIAGIQKENFDNFSPKVGVQLHPAENLMIYASWSKGYKTGGWTTRLSNPLPYAPTFGPEKATSYELGLKSQWLQRRLQLNAAVFQTDYNGIQLTFEQGVSPTIQNAGDARIRGFEVEVVAAPVSGLTINGSVGYLDAVYTKVDPGAAVAPNPDPVFGNYGVYVGATLPKTPKWKFNFSPRYELSLGGRGRLILLADYTYTAKMKNDTEGYFLTGRPSTNIVNASVEYEEPEGRWDIVVGGTNITNDRYLVTGQAQLAGGQIYGTYNRPAEWYTRFQFKF